MCDKAGLDAHALAARDDVAGVMARDSTGSVFAFVVGRGATVSDFAPHLLERQLHAIFKAGRPSPLALSAAKKEEVISCTQRRLRAIVASLDCPRAAVEAELADPNNEYVYYCGMYGWSPPGYDTWVEGRREDIKALDAEGFAAWVRTAGVLPG